MLNVNFGGFDFSFVFSKKKQTHVAYTGFLCKNGECRYTKKKKKENYQILPVNFKFSQIIS
jgi:hypothetical protein